MTEDRASANDTSRLLNIIYDLNHLARMGIAASDTASQMAPGELLPSLENQFARMLALSGEAMDILADQGDAA
ncbi:hypothetical protein [Mangrovicoccus sp. HB161399]|uniref:hypothetical protein n=1 Tax=Mangrovicoccus sp. HB161399 TaxID=2720392 RepID=UPI0015520095|nr:hypothetical protein [Mangrovicoccus sp. HB161399]